ncbi:hypothetical protein AAVH_31623 [Aphelenchoides avenae]|nr:hypothetical protein AAVH_31623 [Aphelenchus avenae]
MFQQGPRPFRRNRRQPMASKEVQTESCNASDRSVQTAAEGDDDSDLDESHLQHLAVYDYDGDLDTASSRRASECDLDNQSELSIVEAVQPRAEFRPRSYSCDAARRISPEPLESLLRRRKLPVPSEQQSTVSSSGPPTKKSGSNSSPNAAVGQKSEDSKDDTRDAFSPEL